MKTLLPDGTCETCGATIPPRPAHHYKNKTPRFCSRACAGPGRNVAARAARASAIRKCRACGVRPALSRSMFCCDEEREQYTRARYAAGCFYGANRMAIKRCRWCAKHYGVDRARVGRMGPLNPYCSRACRRRADAAAQATERSRRRARERNIRSEPIDWRVVGERDGWICYLCGEWAPAGLRGTAHPLAPEIEHVRPLALDGTHTYDNVRLAHRKCNAVKGMGAVEKLPRSPLWTELAPSRVRPRNGFAQGVHFGR